MLPSQLKSVPTIVRPSMVSTDTFSVPLDQYDSSTSEWLRGRPDQLTVQVRVQRHRER